MLAVTGLLLFRTDNPLPQGRTALAIVSILLALIVLGISRSCGRITVGTGPGGRALARSPATAVALIGWGTAILAVRIVLAIALGM